MHANTAIQWWGSRIGPVRVKVTRTYAAIQVVSFLAVTGKGLPRGLALGDAPPRPVLQAGSTSVIRYSTCQGDGALKPRYLNYNA